MFSLLYCDTADFLHLDFARLAFWSFRVKSIDFIYFWISFLPVKLTLVRKD